MASLNVFFSNISGTKCVSENENFRFINCAEVGSYANRLQLKVLPINVIYE